jgi:phosphohistidine phosphatase
VKAVFFRHGPAVPRGTRGVTEEDRPLTAEGRKKTTEAAKGLRKLKLEVTAIYTSPLRRAVQTAEILSDVLRLPSPRLLEALRPEASVRRLFSSLRSLRGETPLLVGHEPMLSSAVSLAIGGRAAIALKKAGMAVVEFSPSASRVAGTLKLLLTPAALRKLSSS